MPRAGLSREAVTAAAIATVDEGGYTGFAALTLAAVASRVGVAVPSLYKHVSSLADLRRDVAVASVRELTSAMGDATIGRSGPDAVRALSNALRDYARRHPGRYAATQVAGNPSDPADNALTREAVITIDVLARVLHGFGLDDDSLIDAIRVLRSAVHGFVVLELGGGFGLPDDLENSFEVLVGMVTAGIEHLARSQRSAASV